MPKMLTKEEVAEIRRVHATEWPMLEGYPSIKDRNALLSHIDALTERLEGMADEWEKEANEIHVEDELPTKSPFNRGDICGYTGSEQKLLVVGEDELYVHTFMLGTGSYYGVFKARPENLESLKVIERSTRNDHHD